MARARMQISKDTSEAHFICTCGQQYLIESKGDFEHVARNMTEHCRASFKEYYLQRLIMYQILSDIYMR